MDFKRAKRMKEQLVANIVSFEEDDTAAVLAFCPDEGKSMQYLMLHRIV